MGKLKLRYNHVVMALVALYTLSLLLQHSRLPPHEQNLLTKFKPSDLDEPPPPVKHNNTSGIIDKDHPHYDKEKIIEMLVQMQVDPFSIENETWAQVPTWTQVSNIWGTQPVVVGLDKHCAAFRQVPAKLRHVAVAGIFSTGTNLLAQLLQHNCGIPERIQWLGRRMGHGMEWQVPYGKHNPFRYRERHQVKEFIKQQKTRGAKLEHYLPVATIRDPYDWFSSICRHSYTFQWPHNANNCPHMVNEQGKPFKLTARFGAEPDHRVPFPSLAHVWNEFYSEYHQSKTPAILVRFEDLIFFPKEVTQQVCECAGGKLLKPHKVYSDKEASGGNFHYVIGSSLAGPGHGKSNPRNGLIDAWIKYAIPKEDRQGKLPKIDVDFAKKVLDSDLVQAFEYDR